MRSRSTGSGTTIQERVIANDPTLADPRAARRRTHQLQHGAASAAPAPKGLLSKFEQPLFGVGQNTIAPSSGFSTDTDSWSAAYDEALEQAKTLPAPAGMQRAVVVITAMRMVFRNTGHHLDGTPDLLGDSNQSSFEAAVTGNEVVLAVAVPGQSPYAVFQSGFKAPHGKPVTRTPNLYPWLPALVSVSDRNAVEIVWDEVVDEMGKVAETSRHAYDDAAARRQSVLDPIPRAARARCRQARRQRWRPAPSPIRCSAPRRLLRPSAERRRRSPRRIGRSRCRLADDSQAACRDGGGSRPLKAGRDAGELPFAAVEAPAGAE